MTATASGFCRAAAAATLVLPAVACLHAAHAADLTIRVTGMSRLAGDVHFGLFDNETDFPRGTSIAGDATPANAETVEFTVGGLLPGDYAVAVFHDANGNGKHDVTLLTIEDFAFSQNAKAVLSPPPFARAAFRVSEPHTTITIDFSK